MATTYMGTDKDDALRSRRGEDVIRGMNGDDRLFDGGLYGQKDADTLLGGFGNDWLFAHWGSDTLQGGVGADVLISRSDAGEPLVAQDPLLPRVNPGEPLLNANDILNGGIGCDVFYFALDLDAPRETIARHADKTGTINWAALHEEGGGPHHHWVEGIGVDTIQDFYRDEGDRIVIDGHRVTATITYEDSNRDGRLDVSVVTLTSDSLIASSHTGDALGQIRVFGDLITLDDIEFHDGHSHHAGLRGATGDISELGAWSNMTATRGDDLMRGTGEATGDRLRGQQGDDTIVDATPQGGSGIDSFSGGSGNDVIYTHWGRDIVNGGGGDDIIVSRSDAGEPLIAQETTRPKIHAKEPFLDANDTLTGGLGADTFVFRFDVDAKISIIAKHMEADGTIDWHGVTGENRRVHDHWTEGFGTDTITDFYRGEGDRIEIYGHTAQVYRIEHRDTDGDRRDDMSVIMIRSNQGNAGAHHLDKLGMIKVYGDLVWWSDVKVDSGSVHGVGTSIDDMGIP